MSGPAEILRVAALSKSFTHLGATVAVLRDVTFTLRPGDSLAVVGPSGCGKTTLIGVCAGIERPSSGAVSLAGHELGQMTEEQRAKLRLGVTGFVFQNACLLPALNALENVQLPAILLGKPATEAAARALLRAVGLADRLSHYPRQLSGGEQQRVALARALINQPQVLFCDEPTGSLDRSTAASVREYLFGFQQQYGVTLVIATHDLDLAARCANQLRLDRTADRPALAIA